MKKLMTRRILQYIAGLVLMAMGVVLTKNTNLGTAPFSSAPVALSGVTSLTLGMATILFQLICTVVIIILVRKVTLKTVLTIVVAFGFGFVIDILMRYIGVFHLPFPVRLVLNVFGAACGSLGIVCINGADLVLPSPDAMLRTISIVFKKNYPLVKNCGDAFWVLLTIAIELPVTGRISSIGIGTLLAAILMGRFVKLFQYLFPWLQVVKDPTL